MTELETTILGVAVEEPTGWHLAWVDERRGIARLTDGARSVTALVEGSGSSWVVTLAGRRIPVSVQTWRERTLAEARLSEAEAGGPIEIRSTLPGLVVAVSVVEGAEVAEGDALVTIEAMKMQNEVRAPRSGRIGLIAVAAGQPVANGVLLMRLD